MTLIELIIILITITHLLSFLFSLIFNSYLGIELLNLEQNLNFWGENANPVREVDNSGNVPLTGEKSPSSSLR